MKTIDKGMDMLSSYMEKAEDKVIPGDIAFKLYDTYGFPVDLTADIAAEKGMSVDEDGFNKLMLEQRERARKARLDSDIIGWKDEVLDYLKEDNSEFVGYERTECDASVVAIVKDGEMIDVAVAGDNVIVVLDKTSFYAESGGQVADTGKLVFENAVVEISDCKKDTLKHFLHIGCIVEGSIEKGDKCSVQIDVSRRNSIKRNHTAAHLLQAALREVLGDHVHQAGSYVDPQRLRFDFSHFSAVTADEIKKIEAIVNEQILKDTVVENYETDFENTKGAMALFGEKYGDRVRVCKIGDFSYELCGGTHIENTGKIGLFKIISEGSVSSGVRRIEAVTGYGILDLIDDYDSKFSDVASVLKVQSLGDIANKCVALMDEVKKLKNEITAINEKAALSQTASIFDSAVTVGDFKVACAKLSDINTKTARTIGDDLRATKTAFVAVFAAVDGDKATMHVVCSDDAVKSGAHAGKIVGEVAAVTGGKGGGKPQSATAGVGDMALIEEALSKAIEIVSKYLN